jgi:hypothetical protein
MFAAVGVRSPSARYTRRRPPVLIARLQRIGERHQIDRLVTVLVDDHHDRVRVTVEVVRMRISSAQSSARYPATHPDDRLSLHDVG